MIIFKKIIKKNSITCTVITCTDQLIYINRVEFVQINKIKVATILVLFVDYSVYYLLACNLTLILLTLYDPGGGGLKVLSPLRFFALTHLI